MKRVFVGAVVACGLSFLATSVSATTMTYNNRAIFEATLGTKITDGYDQPFYPEPFTILTKAQMDAAFGETTYESTFWVVPDWNFITGSTADPNYCSGCNGSFRLTFETTSLGDANGVFGVGFDIESHSFSGSPAGPYSAFVTFGDFSTQDFMFPAGPSFFGITDDMNSIRSIHVAVSNTPTSTGSITIDNLTIGIAQVPEPATLALFGLGLAGLGFARRKRAA